jgi:hypothetical protein
MPSYFNIIVFQYYLAPTENLPRLVPAKPAQTSQLTNALVHQPSRYGSLDMLPPLTFFKKIEQCTILFYNLFPKKAVINI